MDTAKNKCDSCKRLIPPSDVTACVKCENCHGFHHKSCVNITDKDNISSEWRCAECEDIFKFWATDGHENQNDKTPIKMTPSDIKDDKDSVQDSSNKPEPQESAPEPIPDKPEELQVREFQLVMEEIKALRNDVKTFNRQMELEIASIKLSVHTCISRIESLETRLLTAEEHKAAGSQNGIGFIEAFFGSLQIESNDRNQSNDTNQELLGTDVPEPEELSHRAKSQPEVTDSKPVSDRSLVVVRPYTTTDYTMEPTIEQYVGKKYKLQTSENFEEYLKYIGVGLIGRKAASAVTPVSVLTREGDLYTFTMMTTFRTIAFSFKFNEDFDEERPDGCKLKSRMVADGNILIHTQTEPSGRKSVHKRTFTPDLLTVETTAEGWNLTCLRTYEAIP